MHPLISTDELAAANDEPTRRPWLRLYDTTQHLRPSAQGGFAVESAAADHAQAHLPGAAYLDLQRDLSDNASALRFTLPSVPQLEAAFGKAGMADGLEVVLYSSTSPMWATRIWWMLKSLGFAARVLDGGLARWQAEGRPVETGDVRHSGARFTARPQPGHWADKDEVLRAIGNGDVCTINALTASVHAGTAPVHYGRPGHIAGSVNVPFPSLQQADGRLKPVDELRAAFADSGAFGKARAICYCGGGIAATMTALALHLGGHPDVAVYDASLQEWAAQPELPMAVGPAG
ncbi:MAG: sulfurtransferase [Aquabacterium sp.]